MKFIISILIVSLATFGFCQTEELDPSAFKEQETDFYEKPVQNDIQILSKSSNLGIEFRWAPTNVNTWYMAMKNGYTFERIDNSTGEYVPVSGDKIFPWSEEKLRPFVNDDNKYMSVVAMSVYGDKEEGGFVQAANDAQNRHAFSLLSADLDKRAAQAAGLYYLEEDKTDNSYSRYRIYTYDNETSESSDTAYIIGAYLGNEVSLPPELKAIKQQGAIELEWMGGGRMRYNENLTAYYIERSTDGKSFSRLLDDPFVNVEGNLQLDTDYTSYIDSVDSGIEYYYRVIGIDAFADLTEPSNVVSAKAISMNAPNAATELNAVEIENKKISLNWNWESTGDENDIQGFNIYRSPKEDAEYTKINNKLLSANTRDYVDKSPDTDRLNFYYIESVDQNGNVAASAYTLGHIVDLIPPQAPENLTGEISNTGMALISWDAPADTDVMGYEIFFSNSEEYEFIKKATQIIENEFYVDSITLKSLTKDVYYKVAAVDYNYNRSELSEPVTLSRPDVIPPVPSVFRDYKVTEEGIWFEWAASKSDDVKSIVLMRREASGPWTEVLDLDGSVSEYLDRNVEEGVLYEYNLVTTDKSDNISEPEKTLVLEGLKSFYLTEIEDIKLSKKGKQITLNWEYPDAINHNFVVYKAAADGSLLSYKVLEGESSLSLDFQKEKQYTFAVKARAKDGRESKMSEQVSYK